MNKMYNTQEDFASKINIFLKKVFPNIRKTQLKIIPYIIFGMILSESISASAIAKNLKDNFSYVKHDSFLISFLPLKYFIVKLLIMLFIITRKNILIKEFILFLIICIQKRITLF